MEVGGYAALALVGGTGASLLGTALAFHGRQRSLRRVAAAELAALRAAPVRCSREEVAVTGTIVPLDGGDAVVSVVIDEVRSADGLRWEESARTVEARPFLLRLSSGRTLRIEPGAAPTLRSALDEAEPSTPARRRRTARLIAGEQVYVRGVLHGGPGPTAPTPYRDAPWDGVIAAPADGPLLLSTEGSSGELARLARSAGDLRLLMLVLFAVTELLYVAFWYDWARHLLGTGGRPSIILDLFFFVILIDGSFIAGAVGSTWKEGPWYRRSA